MKSHLEKTMLMALLAGLFVACNTGSPASKDTLTPCSGRRQGIPEQVDEVFDETGKEPSFDPEAAGGIEEPVG